MIASTVSNASDAQGVSPKRSRFRARGGRVGSVARQLPGSARVIEGDSPAPPAAPADGAKRRTQAERRRETRARIVNAAALAFDAKGYSGINLAEVVEDLGLTKGALYFHFPGGKDELASLLVEGYFANWPYLVKEVLAEVPNRLDALVELSYGAAYAFQVDPIVRAGARLAAEANLIPLELPRPYVGLLDQVKRLVAEGRRRGEIADEADPAAVSQVVVSFLFGAQHISQVLDGRKSLLKRLEQFWAMFLPTLVPPEEETSAELA